MAKDTAEKPAKKLFVRDKQKPFEPGQATKEGGKRVFRERQSTSFLLDADELAKFKDFAVQAKYPYSVIINLMLLNYDPQIDKFIEVKPKDGVLAHVELDEAAEKQARQIAEEHGVKLAEVLRSFIRQFLTMKAAGEQRTYTVVQKIFV